MAIINKVELGGSTYDIQDARGEQLAEIDGYYEEMTVGDAEQLVATVGVNDKVPYLFRTSGGSADIGDREVDKLIGGTIAWNQLNKNDINSSMNDVDFVSDGNGNIHVSGTPTERAYKYSETTNKINIGEGHVFYSFVRKISGTIPDGIRFGGSFYNDSTWKGDWSSTSLERLLKVPSGSNIVARTIIEITSDVVSSLSGGSVDFTVSTQFFDLTQLFGSTIADYILALETSNAGAGIAWFRNLFPKPYYAYDAGSLQSVQAASHVMVGFNAWDEEWEIGGYNTSNGGKANFTDRIRCKNPIPVKFGYAYFLEAPVPSGSYYSWCWYDSNDEFISGSQTTSAIMTAPNYASFLRFSMPSNYGTTYNHDICINLSWDGERDGEYEPYEAHTYPLDSDLVLRGIPKLDSGNHLYYDGDIYEADGTVTRKYGVVDLGTLSYSYQSDNLRFSTSGIASVIKKPATSSTVPNVILSGYMARDYVDLTNHRDDFSIAVHSTSGDVYVINKAYTNASTFKTAMSGKYLVYELATPTTESADTFQNPQIVDDFGTEQYTEWGTRDVAVPVGHDTMYRNNLRAKLEMSPESPSGDGDYIVRQTNGMNEYVALTFPADELPAPPSSDGNYVLKCTISSGTATYSWASE